MSSNVQNVSIAGKSDDPASLVPSTNTMGVISIVLIQIITICLSAFLVYIIGRMRQKSPTNLLILNQTISDLLNGTIFAPMVVISHFGVTALLDAALKFSIAYIVLVSLISLMAMAAYRYKSCRNPVRQCNYQITSSESDNKYLLRYIAIMWIFPFLFCITPFTWSKAPASTQKVAFRVFQGFLWVVLVTLFLTLAVLYILIFRFLNEHLKTKVSVLSMLPKLSEDRGSASSDYSFSADIRPTGRTRIASRRTSLRSRLLSFNSTNDTEHTETQNARSNQLNKVLFRSKANSSKDGMMATVCTSDESSQKDNQSNGDSKLPDLLKGPDQKSHTEKQRQKQQQEQQQQRQRENQLPPQKQETNQQQSQNHGVRNLKKMSLLSGRQKREVRMKRLLGSLMLSIFVSYFPILLLNFEHLFQINMQLPHWFHTLSLYTFILNSAVSPLLCMLMKRDLTHSAKSWFADMTGRSYTPKRSTLRREPNP